MPRGDTTAATGGGWDKKSTEGGCGGAAFIKIFGRSQVLGHIPGPFCGVDMLHLPFPLQSWMNHEPDHPFVELTIVQQQRTIRT